MLLLEYAKKSNHTIDVNDEIDALLLSQSVYFDFETYLNENTLYPLRLQNIQVNPKAKFKNKLKQKHHQLMMNLLTNSRFSSLSILDFRYDFNIIEEKQFAVIVYLVNDRDIFVAFRGTDATVLGWKEDFNMSFEMHVNSQLTSVDYMNDVVFQMDYPIYIGGHSKGGNLAVYAGAYCQNEIKKRIQRIYNFDGPGFHSEIIASSSYMSIVAKTTKYVPTASIIGKLLNTFENEMIITSKQVSIFQHSAYNWIIDGQHFRYQKETSRSSRKFSKSLQKWMETISDQQRELVINEFYSGFQSLGIVTLDDMTKLVSPTGFKETLDWINTTDPVLRENLKSMIKEFLVAFLDS